jgi:hypothetical protein
VLVEFASVYLKQARLSSQFASIERRFEAAIKSVRPASGKR